MKVFFSFNGQHLLMAERAIVSMAPLNFNPVPRKGSASWE
jgi:hypothetical protein